MCGRYVFTSKETELSSEFPDLDIQNGIVPRTNISPGMDISVVQKKKVPMLVSMRWGLIPSWSKDHSLAFKTFNARSETVTEKPTFRNPFKRKRCLIPVNGFYEWKIDDKKKIPHYIYLKTKKILYFAGLYDEWEGPNGYLESCTILTTIANKEMSQLHERMPVILTQEEFSIWLDPLENEKKLHSLLKPFSHDKLDVIQLNQSVKEGIYPVI